MKAHLAGLARVLARIMKFHYDQVFPQIWGFPR